MRSTTGVRAAAASATLVDRARTRHDHAKGAGSLNLFIFGAGYSALAIAGELRGPGASIAGTARSSASLERIRQAGLAPHAFPAADPRRTEEALATASHVLATIPPDAAGDPVLAAFGDVLERAAPRLEWIGYLSTTGVYGDHGGGWVDEDSPCLATAPRSLRRVEAEHAWRELGRRRNTPVAVLRLSGLYGPGRNALASLEKGEARRIAQPGNVFNRVHVADIAGATALLARARTAGVFNISDDEPAPPDAVILHAAALMGQNPPPEIPLDSPMVSPGLRAFYQGSRRVSNRRIRNEGYAFRFPDYRSGLGALWKEGNWR
jgi:nucleoside-diphosphate-sugar epimerase